MAGCTVRNSNNVRVLGVPASDIDAAPPYLSRVVCRGADRPRAMRGDHVHPTPSSPSAVAAPPREFTGRLTCCCWDPTSHGVFGPARNSPFFETSPHGSMSVSSARELDDGDDASYASSGSASSVFAHMGRITAKRRTITSPGSPLQIFAADERQFDEAMYNAALFSTPSAELIDRIRKIYVRDGYRFTTMRSGR